MLSLSQFFKRKRSINHFNGPLARYVTLWVVHAPGMPGTFSPPPRVNDPDMHHGTCVTHVPWCMSGSQTRGFLRSRRQGETFQAFPAHAQTTILRIWQEAHVTIAACYKRSSWTSQITGPNLAHIMWGKAWLMDCDRQLVHKWYNNIYNNFIAGLQVTCIT